MRRWHHLGRDQRGVAAVEFALLLPILLLFVFATVELGSAWYNRQVLVSASREGARFGVLFNAEGISDAQVESHVRDLLSKAGFGPAVEVNSSGAGGGPGSLVTVVCTAQHTLPVLGSIVPGLESSVSLSATTVMRHE